MELLAVLESKSKQLSHSLAQDVWFTTRELATHRGSQVDVFIRHASFAWVPEGWWILGRKCILRVHAGLVKKLFLIFIQKHEEHHYEDEHDIYQLFKAQVSEQKVANKKSLAERTVGATDSTAYPVLTSAPRSSTKCTPFISFSCT